MSSNSPKRQRQRGRETEGEIEREIGKKKKDGKIKSEREKKKRISKLFWNIHRREIRDLSLSVLGIRRISESDPSTGLSGQANQSEICLTTG